MSVWAYSTGKEPFEDTLRGIFTLIIKARALGPTSVEMNFNDYAGEFMGQLDQDLHMQSKIWLRNLQKGMRVAELDSELAGLYVKPMDAEARLAVEQLAP